MGNKTVSYSLVVVVINLGILWVADDFVFVYNSLSLAQFISLLISLYLVWNTIGIVQTLLPESEQDSETSDEVGMKVEVRDGKIFVEKNGAQYEQVIEDGSGSAKHICVRPDGMTIKIGEDTKWVPFDKAE
jgi:hypothetical protein